MSTQPPSSPFAQRAADLLALLGPVADGHVLDGADARTLVVLPRAVYAEIARQVDAERARSAERERRDG